MFNKAQYRSEAKQGKIVWFQSNHGCGGGRGSPYKKKQKQKFKFKKRWCTSSENFKTTMFVPAAVGVKCRLVYCCSEFGDIWSRKTKKKTLLNVGCDFDRFKNTFVPSCQVNRANTEVRAARRPASSRAQWKQAAEVFYNSSVTDFTLAVPAAQKNPKYTSDLGRLFFPPRIAWKNARLKKYTRSVVSDT